MTGLLETEIESQQKDKQTRETNQEKAPPPLKSAKERIRECKECKTKLDEDLVKEAFSEIEAVFKLRD